MRNVTGIAWIVLKRMYSYPSLLFSLSLSLLNILFQMGRPSTDAGWYPTRGYTAILPSRNILAIVLVGELNSTNLLITIYHPICLTFRRLLPFSIPSIPVRGTFTPVYAGSCGGTVSPGGMMIYIGAIGLSSRYETPRSRVLSLADE